MDDPAERRRRLKNPLAIGSEIEKTGGEAEASPPVLMSAPDPSPDGARLMPLDVILESMRRKWRKGDHKGAEALAKAAAPYVHARAAPVRDGGSTAIEGKSDAELELALRGGTRVGDAEGNPPVIEGLVDGGIGAG